MIKIKKGIIIGIIFLLGFVVINLKKSDALAVYVDGEYQITVPKKGEALFSRAICDDDVNISWNNDKWNLFISNLDKKVKCNLYFVKYTGDTVFNFNL